MATAELTAVNAGPDSDAEASEVVTEPSPAKPAAADTGGESLT
jgi:hypothetical protein